MRLVRAYLERTDSPVVLWVRAADAGEFKNKRDRLQSQFSRYESRIQYQCGDLSQEHPFDSVDPRGIRTIIHAAAVTRFNVDAETADRVNTRGVERLLKFASACDSLEAIGVLSTVYASGLRSGMIAEAPLEDEDGFANHYERSKRAAETKLVRDFGYLPWRILRVATVVADDASGRVTQFNAFHNTLKLLYYGLISMLPGKTDTPVYLVTGDFVTDAVFRLMHEPENKAIYHICHTKSDSLTLGELVDAAYDCFAAQPEFAARRIMKPLYADVESFEMLGTAIDTFGGAIINQAMSSISPFARQLFVSKEFQNARMAAALGDYRPADQRRLVTKTCRYLVSSKWGREEVRDLGTDN